MKLLAKQTVGGMSVRAVATVVKPIANDVQRVVQNQKVQKLAKRVAPKVKKVHY